MQFEFVEILCSSQSYHSGIMWARESSESKRRHQLRKILHKSPAPPNVSVTFSAMSCASNKSLSDILAGCQLSDNHRFDGGNRCTK
jgi:hypothetical protein